MEKYLWHVTRALNHGVQIVSKMVYMRIIRSMLIFVLLHSGIPLTLYSHQDGEGKNGWLQIRNGLTAVGAGSFAVAAVSSRMKRRENSMWHAKFETGLRSLGATSLAMGCVCHYMGQKKKRNKRRSAVSLDAHLSHTQQPQSGNPIGSANKDARGEGESTQDPKKERTITHRDARDVERDQEKQQADDTSLVFNAIDKDETKTLDALRDRGFPFHNFRYNAKGYPFFYALKHNKLRSIAWFKENQKYCEKDLNTRYRPSFDGIMWCSTEHDRSGRLPVLRNFFELYPICDDARKKYWQQYFEDTIMHNETHFNKDEHDMFVENAHVSLTSYAHHRLVSYEILNYIIGKKVSVVDKVPLLQLNNYHYTSLGGYGENDEDVHCDNERQSSSVNFALTLLKVGSPIDPHAERQNYTNLMFACLDRPLTLLPLVFLVLGADPTLKDPSGNNAENYLHAKSVNLTGENRSIVTPYYSDQDYGTLVPKIFDQDLRVLKAEMTKELQEKCAEVALVRATQNPTMRNLAIAYYVWGYKEPLKNSFFGQFCDSQFYSKVPLVVVKLTAGYCGVGPYDPYTAGLLVKCLHKAQKEQTAQQEGDKEIAEIIEIISCKNA